MKKKMVSLLIVMILLVSLTSVGFAQEQSKDVYKEIVEGQQNLICTFLPDTTLTFVNDAYADYFGKTQEELKGVKFLNFIPEEFHKGVKDKLASFSVDKPVMSYEHAVIKPNGEKAWQKWIDQANFNEKGEVVSFQSICIDITDIKEREQKIIDNQVYRNIVENQSNLVCTFAPDTTLTFVNKAYADYFKKSPEELVGVKFLTLVPEEARQGIKDYLNTFSVDKQTQSYEHKVNKPNGEVVWQKWIDQGVFNEKGEIVSFQSICIDITDIKEKEVK